MFRSASERRACLFLIAAGLLFVCNGFVLMFAMIKAQVACPNTASVLTRHILGPDNIHDTTQLDSLALLQLFESQVTVVVREFEEHENVLIQSISSLTDLFPLINVIVLASKLPYPPLLLPDNVQVIPLEFFPERAMVYLDDYIKTEFVLLFPDSSHVTKDSKLHELPLELDEHRWKAVIAPQVQFASDRNLLTCRPLNVSVQTWSMTIGLPQPASGNSACDWPESNTSLREPIMLIRYRELRQILWTEKPTAASIAIQFKMRQWEIGVSERSSVHDLGDTLLAPTSHHGQRFLSRRKASFSQLYTKMGIKKVSYIESNYKSALPKVEWHNACAKDTGRCFGTVRADTPEFILRGRWTPPCCLDALRVTGRYVIARLEKANVRYWLEGGSLLGAARNGDIIPWDYDLDIGIHRDDLHLISELQALKEMAPNDKVHGTDDSSFIWERSRKEEGDFYRVQYSATNHLHVDIWPFYENAKGMMTKDTWMATHPQDREFGAKFLQPLDTLPFIGLRKVKVPNNHRRFLEFKFGAGCIEHPQYPHSPKTTYGDLLSFELNKAMDALPKLEAVLPLTDQSRGQA